MEINIPAMTNNNINCQDVPVVVHMPKSPVCMHFRCCTSQRLDLHRESNRARWHPGLKPPWSTQADFPSGGGKRIWGCQTVGVPCGCQRSVEDKKLAIPDIPVPSADKSRKGPSAPPEPPLIHFRPEPFSPLCVCFDFWDLNPVSTPW